MNAILQLNNTLDKFCNHYFSIKNASAIFLLYANEAKNTVYKSEAAKCQIIVINYKIDNKPKYAAFGKEKSYGNKPQLLSNDYE